MPTTRTEGDLPDSCFAHVPDGPKSGRKLRLCSLETGELDAVHVGAAAAALGPGYRGQKVRLPAGAKEAAVRKVRAAWRKVNPDRDDDEMPSGIHASESGVPDDAAPIAFGAGTAGEPASCRPLLFAAGQEWIPFLPKPGKYRHPLYGEIDLSGDRNARFVASFDANVYGQDLPINAEHDGRASGAVGWITAMRLAADGSVEVKPAWNDRGRALLSGDRFRYVSAEFFDRWQHPVTGDWHDDVPVGLAICTRPYFKTDVLRPLAASEAAALALLGERDGEPVPAPNPQADPMPETPESGQADDAGGAGKESGMAEDQPTTTTPPEAPADTTPPTPDVKALTEQILAELGGESTISSPTVRQFVERAAAELAEARADKARSEAESREMAIQNARLLAENRAKTFTDEVTGKSPENGTVWYGAIPDHVRMLRSLAEKFGTDSWEFRQYRDSNRAAAEAIKAGALFSELGTGRGPDRTQSAYDKLAALARERMVAAEQTFEQAFDAVLNTERELAVAYMREQRP